MSDLSKQNSPISHMRSYGERYREAWRIAETLRSRCGSDNFPDWPDWCYLPAWYVERDLVAQGRESLPFDRAMDIMSLTALCAWRMGKGVYRFDPDLMQELWNTPISGEIPVDVLLRLPGHARQRLFCFHRLGTTLRRPRRIMFKSLTQSTRACYRRHPSCSAAASSKECAKRWAITCKSPLKLVR